VLRLSPAATAAAAGAPQRSLAAVHSTAKRRDSLRARYHTTTTHQASVIDPLPVPPARIDLQQTPPIYESRLRRNSVNARQTVPRNCGSV